MAGRWGPGERARHRLGAAAALLDPGGRAWVLVERDADRSLGPALVWAERHGVSDLHLLAGAPDRAGGTAAAGLLARQAAYFTAPPAVWAVAPAGTDGAPDAPVPALVPAPPAPVPARAEAPAPTDLVDLLIDAGLEIVVEGGLVRGEVNGLEVARIVAGTTTAGEPIDTPQLEVGVGKADRELTALVHGGLPPVDQLARVVEIVRAHRRPGAPRHPLNQLVPDRWLRAVLCRAPGLVGLASLRPAEGARPRRDLSERGVAVATGETGDGVPVVVACTVGMALDLVPTAADARATVAPGARLLLAVPARDDHPGTRRLAARLKEPAEVVTIPGDWGALA
ncbi:MAG TPA: hypothetical protein VFI47_27475 [Acidimicrobiales bacterium]|nr:hypothetical protein [Acidimicrobiales bacterium]